MSKTRYTFELHCPRCKKDTVIVLLSADEVDNLKCGDCLMEDVEVIHMVIDRVHVENTQ
jgi:Zn ribbon nucleic-acid-binding protein